MNTSFYSGLSGMLAFQQGLDGLGHNLSNLNTPGFMGSNAFFRALSGNNGAIFSENRDFEAGDFQTTNNPLDLAVNGNGFFILENDSGERFYTKNGQTYIDEDGVIRHRETDFAVMGFGDAGVLVPMNIKDLFELDAIQTNNIDISGILNLNDSEFPKIDPVDGSRDEFEIKFFNALGEELTFELEFENLAPTPERGWAIRILDPSSNDVIAETQLEFGVDGFPLEEMTNLSITIPEEHSGELTEDMVITLNFGRNDENVGLRLRSDRSTQIAFDANGHGTIGFQNIEFNTSGELTLKYPNGDEESPYTIALAHFASTNMLQFAEGSIFRAIDDSHAEVGNPDDGIRGPIQSEVVQGANVDMVEAFADIIKFQRGYQASSKIMQAVNELLEETYNIIR
jgi:flagellar hook protein FlgE